MPYLYLSLAILAEVIGTSALKASHQFSQPLPSVIAVAAYLTSLYFLSLVLKTIPMGIAYAIWSAIGVVLIALSGSFIFKQIPDLPAVLGITLIIIGVVIINVFSSTVRY